MTKNDPWDQFFLCMATMRRPGDLKRTVPGSFNVFTSKDSASRSKNLSDAIPFFGSVFGFSGIHGEITVICDREAGTVDVTGVRIVEGYDCRIVGQLAKLIAQDIPGIHVVTVQIGIDRTDYSRICNNVL